MARRNRFSPTRLAHGLHCLQPAGPEPESLAHHNPCLQLQAPSFHPPAGTGSVFASFALNLSLTEITRLTTYKSDLIVMNDA